ncbi:hypothetical protein [uncultured Chryseobacterium sp.]|uniref:hypothetical protein n=1 Tax=uncultured Chryseobacterium sp. TaxID=259322 RepID=UPI0025E11C01|nr:hypothetical protein [uncultured Chryseobacterium sp.]
MIKIPIGKMSGDRIDSLFQRLINGNINQFYSILSQYDKESLFQHWSTLVRSIDELINFPSELFDDENELLEFQMLNCDFEDENNARSLMETCQLLRKRFGDEVAKRFIDLFMMAFDMENSINFKLTTCHSGFSLNTIGQCINYFQARRIYFVTVLNLIPKIANGEKVIPYDSLFNDFLFEIEVSLVNVTSAYYNLLINKCLPDFELDFDGTRFISNFRYSHLESFFLEPERLSLLDQLEFRPDTIQRQELIEIPDNKLFSFTELLNTMLTYESTFDKYSISRIKQFDEFNSLICGLKPFIEDDFNIIVDEQDFHNFTNTYTSINLYNGNDNFLENLDSYLPFQKLNRTYFSTVVLFNRFIYKTFSYLLSKSRKFQINSGFIFESKISKILEEKGFKVLPDKRIKKKEFDIITTKDGKIYNFQCKNNFIDFSSFNSDYNKLARANNRFCRYYYNALIKEEKREDLIKEKIGLSEIEHFVISRFPVITKNPRIINFNDLPNWNLFEF